MKNSLLLFSSLTLMILLTACETTNSRNNQFASSNQDIVELQNEIAVLKRKMANARTYNVQIMKKISSLQKQINYVNEANQQQNKTITALNLQLTKERAERQAALKKVVETVADQTAKAVNTIAKQGRPKAVKIPKSIPAGAYYKHKVCPGETLSAIARAYKVSVTDIKKTNRLKNNIIRVGQILHIPKK
ncbi:MAG: LysM peptidoglycan-binding domain-containing protein [Victivallales bacterium]|nr:LysM peptidoglycan-binding domain-containing protein [Victivallales bacterium]